jgi:hypothetical protein
MIVPPNIGVAIITAPPPIFQKIVEARANVKAALWRIRTGTR